MQPAKMQERRRHQTPVFTSHLAEYEPPALDPYRIEGQQGENFHRRAEIDQQESHNAEPEQHQGDGMCGDNSAPAAGRPAGAGLELHADLATAPGPMQRLYAVYVLGPRDFDNLMTGLLENPVRQAAGGQQRTQWPQVVADVGAQGGIVVLHIS